MILKNNDNNVMSTNPIKKRRKHKLDIFKQYMNANVPPEVIKFITSIESRKYNSSTKSYVIVFKKNRITLYINKTPLFVFDIDDNFVENVTNVINDM